MEFPRNPSAVSKFFHALKKISKTTQPKTWMNQGDLSLTSTLVLSSLVPKGVNGALITILSGDMGTLLDKINYFCSTLIVPI